MQLADCSWITETRNARLILDKVSPGWMVYNTQPEGGPQKRGTRVIVLVVVSVVVKVRLAVDCGGKNISVPGMTDSESKQFPCKITARCTPLKLARAARSSPA